jgi:hypothetical protein
MSSKGPPGLFIAAGSSKDNCNGKNKRIDRSAFAPLLKACRFRQSGLRIGPCHYLIGDHLVERAFQAVVIMGAHFVIHQPVHHVPTFPPYSAMPTRLVCLVSILIFLAMTSSFVLCRLLIYIA